MPTLRLAAVAIALAAASPAAAQEGAPASDDDSSAPYAGTWDCDVAVLVITDTTYDPGNGALDIASVAANDGTYTLTLAGGSTVVLTPGEEGMTMSAPPSGEVHDCARVED